MEVNENEEAIPRSELVTLKEVYFHSVLLDPRSVTQFKFYEDVSTRSGMDKYILLAEDNDPAIFHVVGTLTHLSVTAAGALQNRRPNSKIDEYTARLHIDNDKNQESVQNGFSALIDLLKSTPKACENIAVSSGPVEKRKLFKLEETTVKVSSYTNNVLYFNRKVANRDRAITDDGETPDFMLKIPRQGHDYPVLHYPAGWHLNSLIPITDIQAVDLDPEDIQLPRAATIYFEVRQGCYNFFGNDGRVRQIVLIPSIIAIKVHPPESQELTITQKAKRRRISY